VTESPAKQSAEPVLLALNGGSSSIRFAFFQVPGRSSTVDLLRRTLHGQIERIGRTGTTLRFKDVATGLSDSLPLGSSDFPLAVEYLLKWLENRPEFAALQAIGHRVVHGMQHSQPALISTMLLSELRSNIALCPEHLPGEIALIEAFRTRHPTLVQVACFDTAFHHDLPRVAQWLAIPRRYAASGIRRYGFHGLSCEFLMAELGRVAGRAAASGKVILAHLGNGASLTAVHDRKPIDTSMGFTPSSGLPMGNRSGDLDPGLVDYLTRTQNMDVSEYNKMINTQSGLLGISESSSDMRDLLLAQATDVRAAEAITLFCYQTRKWIGAFAAALNGLDTLVFAGGIGEHAPEVRARICAGLEFLGIKIDQAQNAAGNALISTLDSRVAVRLIHTDEEQIIARALYERLITEDKGNDN
jgi:acetate kinase